MKSICATFLTLISVISTAAWGDTASEWNKRAETATVAAKQTPAESARTIATVQSAMAAATISLQHGNGFDAAASSRDAARSTASAIAAFAILEHLCPDQHLDLEIWLAVSLADIPESQAKADALVVGRKAANEILARKPQ